MNMVSSFSSPVRLRLGAMIGHCLAQRQGTAVFSEEGQLPIYVLSRLWLTLDKELLSFFKYIIPQDEHWLELQPNRVFLRASHTT